MSAPGLQLDQAPPLSVPLRFFLTAPLFGVLAGLLLLWDGPAGLASRWTSTSLAFTHLLTLGFLTSTMLGALLQMLPVLAGVRLAHASPVSGAVHGLFTAGTVALATGFLAPGSGAFPVALLLLGTALAAFIGVALERLWHAPVRDATTDTMRLALVGLTITAALGIALALGTRAGAQSSWTGVHLGWGLLGWVAMLIGGVAWQVVPTFQLTPSYPAWLRRAYAPVLFFTLLGLSAALLVAPDRLAEMFFGVTAAAALALFAGATLWLQRQRRRRLPDVTLAFWRLAMASLLAVILLWFAAAAQIVHGERLAFLYGVLFLLGFATSAVHGMLYKIVPFLLWLHLHRHHDRDAQPNMTISPGAEVAQGRADYGAKDAKLDAYSAPAGRSPRMVNVKEILPDRRTRAHLWLHALALVAALGAGLLPDLFTYPAALLLLLSFGWLERNLLAAVWLYRHLVRTHAHVA